MALQKPRYLYSSSIKIRNIVAIGHQYHLIYCELLLLHLVLLLLMYMIRVLSNLKTLSALNNKIKSDSVTQLGQTSVERLKSDG